MVGYFLYASNVRSEQQTISSSNTNTVLVENAADKKQESPLRQTLPDQIPVQIPNWKTYTNSAYGFSFQYPPTWSLNPQSNEIVGMSTRENAPSGLPRELISIQVIDSKEDYWTGGDIRFVSKIRGFVSEYQKNSCIAPVYEIGTFKKTSVTYPLYVWSSAKTGDAMSVSMSIITNKDYFLFVTQRSESPIDNDVSKVFGTLRFENGTTAIESCRPGENTEPMKRTSLYEPVRITSPSEGQIFKFGMTQKVTWLSEDGLMGDLAVLLSNSTNGWSCLVGTAPVAARSLTFTLNKNQFCPTGGQKFDAGDYYLLVSYPYNAQDPFNSKQNDLSYGNGSGNFVHIQLAE